MKTNALTLVITLTVGILLAGAMLVPIINEATTTEKTFQNAGYYDVRYIEADQDLSVSWDYTDPLNITVDGDSVTLPTDAASNTRRTVLASDTFILRYYLAPGPVFQYSDSNSTTYMSPSDENDFSFEFSEGTMTFTFGTTVKTIACEYVYVIDNTGPYVMKESNEAAYMKGDSEFIGIGITSIGGSNKTLYINGTIDEGAEITSWDSTLTFTDISVNSTSVNGYKDLYTLESITAKSGTTDITYSYFMVPASVTAELSQHLSPAEIAILNALPVLIIVTLIMMAAGALYLKRDD